MKDQPRFDIFAGSIDNDATWIECIPGLEKARERMEQIAAEKPGRYFVFSIHNRTVLAKVDTTTRRGDQMNDKQDVA
jgi:hypothetical protein